MGYRRLGVLLSLLVCFVATSAPLNAADVTTADIREAWLNRKEKAQRLHLKASTECVSRIPGPGSKNAKPVQFQFTSELWLEDDFLCYERLTPGTNVKWQPSRMRYVTNSDGIQQLSTPPGTNTVFDSKSFGRVTHDPLNSKGSLTADFFLFMLAYRFREDGPFAVDITQAEIEPLTQVVNGIDCVVLRSEWRSNPENYFHIWVDAARDFVPMQIMAFYSQKPIYQLSAEYVPNAKTDYAISSWKYTVLDGAGQFASSETAAVQSFDVPETLPSETFQITFPPGSKVALLDEPGKSVRVDSDGQVQGFKTGSTSAGQVGTQSPNLMHYSFYAILTFGGLGLLLLGFLWLRKKEAKRASR